MITLYPFLFRFGISFNYSIPKEIIESVRVFFQAKYSININLNQSADSYDCIAISDKDAEYTPILGNRFTERLNEYGIADFQQSILFIDIKSVYSHKFVDSFLIPEIIKIKNEHKLKTGTFPNFILYFDELESKSLTYDKLFTSHASNKILDFCYVFDKNGNFLNPKLEIAADSNLHTLVNDTSTSALERFQFKLVRKINHFERLDDNSHSWAACQQFFYEGQNCDEEVFQLLKEELLKMHKEGINPHYIVYHTLYSEWLTRAIESVSNTIGSRSFEDVFTHYSKKHSTEGENHLNLAGVNDIRNSDDWISDEEGLEIVFITDLIHTGNTFKEKIKKVSKKFPNAKITCLSALVTDHAYEENKSTNQETDRKFQINSHVVRYFKKVEQIYIPRSSNGTKCHMCKHNLLPPANIKADILPGLSSYEMWLMSEESGYKIEDYRPRRREDVNRLVPHSLKLFKKNGTLLAIKFEEQLKLAEIYPNIEIVILFPDETQNDYEDGLPESIEKTPSGYFAKCLNFYNNKYTYLGIPRKMIKLLEEKNADWDKVQKQFPKILKQIEDIDKPIVILDEANFTGKTFRTIADILRNKGKYPVCYFPIFNYDAQRTNDEFKKEYDSVKFLNLYELNFA